MLYYKYMIETPTNNRISPESINGIGNANAQDVAALNHWKVQLSAQTKAVTETQARIDTITTKIEADRDNNVREQLVGKIALVSGTVEGPAKLGLYSFEDTNRPWYDVTDGMSAFGMELWDKDMQDNRISSMDEVLFMDAYRYPDDIKIDDKPLIVVLLSDLKGNLYRTRLQTARNGNGIYVQPRHSAEQDELPSAAALIDAVDSVTQHSNAGYTLRQLERDAHSYRLLSQGDDSIASPLSQGMSPIIALSTAIKYEGLSAPQRTSLEEQRKQLFATVVAGKAAVVDGIILQGTPEDTLNYMIATDNQPERLESEAAIILSARDIGEISNDKLFGSAVVLEIEHKGEQRSILHTPAL